MCVFGNFIKARTTVYSPKKWYIISIYCLVCISKYDIDTPLLNIPKKYSPESWTCWNHQLPGPLQTLPQFPPDLPGDRRPTFGGAWSGPGGNRGPTRLDVGRTGAVGGNGAPQTRVSVPLTGVTPPLPNWPSNGHPGGDPDHLPNLGWSSKHCWEFCWCFFQGFWAKKPGSDIESRFQICFAFAVLIESVSFYMFVSLVVSKKPTFFRRSFWHLQQQKTNSSTKWLILVWNSLAFYYRSLWSTRLKYGNIWNAIFNTTHTHT